MPMIRVEYKFWNRFWIHNDSESKNWFHFKLTPSHSIMAGQSVPTTASAVSKVQDIRCAIFFLINIQGLFVVTDGSTNPSTGGNAIV